MGSSNDSCKTNNQRVILSEENSPGDCFRSRTRPKGGQGVALGSRNESCYPFPLKGCKFTEKSYWYSFVDPASTHASRAFAPFAKLLRNFFHCAKVRLRRRYTPSFAQDDSLIVCLAKDVRRPLRRKTSTPACQRIFAFKLSLRVTRLFCIRPSTNLLEQVG